MPGPDLARLADAAADPWPALKTLFDADAHVHTQLQRGLYYTLAPNTQPELPPGVGSSAPGEPIKVDLGGPVRVQPEHLHELLRHRAPIAARQISAPWDELVTVHVGGPVVISLESLLVAAADLRTRGIRPPARPPSRRDQERLQLGADALLTVRRAAELLPGDDQANRQAIAEAGISRVVHETDGGERKRTVLAVRWGDITSLFPTASEKAETERIDREREIKRDLEAQPRRKRRRRKGGGIRMADL